MKRGASVFRFFSLIFLTLLMATCKKDDDSPVISITAAETSVQVPASEGNYEVAIEASGTNWTVTEEIAWFEAVKVDNSTLRLSYNQNPDAAERSGIVTAALSDKSVAITVTQDADKRPAFATDALIANQTYKRNVEIPTLTLPAATGGDGTLTYSISPELPTGLAFNTTDRVITGTPESDLPPTTFTYAATDEDGDTAELTFTITIGSVPSFASDAVIANQIYRQHVEIPTLTLPEATGGDGALTYSLSPELPAGLSFTANTRMLSGKPEDVMMPAVTFTYRAEDEDGDAAVLTFTLIVEANAMPAFAVDASVAAQIYTEGKTITDVILPEAMGGNGDLTYSLAKSDGNALPTGLTFTSATRVLSGGPETGTALSAADYTLTATDIDGDEVKLTFNITIRAAGATPIRLNAQMRRMTASTTDNTVMLTSDVDWEAAKTEDWITAVTPDIGTGTGNPTVIALTYQENGTFEDRIGTITFTETTAGASPPFEVTLEVSQAAGSALSTIAYEIAAEDDTDASVNFGSAIAFGPGVTHWWVTAADGSPASGIDGIMSISTNASTRALTRATGFTINVEENPGTTDRDFSLRLQLGTRSGDAIASTAFTVTQKGQAVILGKTAYTIGARGGIDMTITFEGLTFRSDITHWWITAADGALPTDMAEIRSVSHDGTTGKRQTVSETAFIMIVENNTRTADKNFALRLQAGTDSDPAIASVPFNVTQEVRQADGMIPVSTLEQLNAIRYDLTADGQEDDTGGLSEMRQAQMAYAAAFPNVVYASGRYAGYMLTKDLDFKDAGSYASRRVNTTWTTGAGWRPIGFFRNVNNNAPFSGTFDGAGYKIDNLYINRGQAGLFWYLTGTIRNLGLENANVRGRREVGGLVAWQAGGTISGCYLSEGTITGIAAGDAGGLVGYQGGGTVSNCYVSGGTIGGGSTTTSGGLVAWHRSGTISNCYVSGGTVTGTTRVGGLVGYVFTPLNVGPSIINDCYVMNTTSSGGANLGSLIGAHAVSPPLSFGPKPVGLVFTCYAAGQDYTKLIGSVSANSTVRHSFHQAASSDGRGRTSSQLQTPTGFTGVYTSWNKIFNRSGIQNVRSIVENRRTTTPWDFGSNAQYPALKGIDVNGDGKIDAADLAAQR